MVQVQSSATGDNAQEGPGQNHERNSPLQDTVDAKKPVISKPSEQEQNERVQKVLQVAITYHWSVCCFQSSLECYR